MTVRILAVCGNGQGSSMIMKMKVDQFFNPVEHRPHGKQLRGWRIQKRVERCGYHHRFYPYCGRNHRDRQQICGWRAQHALSC